MKNLLLVILLVLFVSTACGSNEIVSDKDKYYNDILKVESITDLNIDITGDVSNFNSCQSSIEEGQDIIQALVTINNNTENELDYNFINFVGYDMENNQIPVNSLCYQDGVEPLLSGSVAPDSSISGVIYFTIEKDQKIQQIEFQDSELNIISLSNVE